jgi:hypothetical protein
MFLAGIINWVCIAIYSDPMQSVFGKRDNKVSNKGNVKHIV